MFTTRQAGPVYTSVRGYPIKLMIAAIAALGVGIAILCNPNSIWSDPIGCALVLIGAKMAHIAARQIGRSVRTFLS